MKATTHLMNKMAAQNQRQSQKETHHNLSSAKQDTLPKAAQIKKKKVRKYMLAPFALTLICFLSLYLQFIDFLALATSFLFLETDDFAHTVQ